MVEEAELESDPEPTTELEEQGGGGIWKCGNVEKRNKAEHTVGEK